MPPLLKNKKKIDFTKPATYLQDEGWSELCSCGKEPKNWESVKGGPWIRRCNECWFKEMKRRRGIQDLTVELFDE